ncbi:MAG TPA: hypothetical protein PLE74_09000 [Candidatus Cloacimonadota bacterium]|nr:hypothetical protein [Candidatus Cloacimonadota bacterium]
MKRLILLLMITIFSIALYSQGFEGRPHHEHGNPPPDMNQDNPMLGEGQRDFQGYLVDRTWGERGTDDKGKDITKKPALITLKHLKTKEAVKDGYGMLIELPHHGYVFARFDTSGSLRAEDYLSHCKQKSKIFVKVKGFMSKDHVISVTDLESASSNQMNHEGRHMGGEHPRDFGPGNTPGNRPGNGFPGTGAPTFGED